MIRALAVIAQEFPGAYLVLIGEDRGLASELSTLTTEIGLEGRVIMLGQRADIPELLQAMDVGILASHEEGFSNSLLEMLHAGLPVVATSVGGNIEALANVPGCHLVPPKDPNKLASALRSVLTDSTETPERASVRSQTVRDSYSRVAMCDAYDQLYRKLVS